MSKENQELQRLRRRITLLEKIEGIRNDFELDSYIELAKLKDSTQLVERLAVKNVLQLHHRNDKVGILLESELFQALIDYVNLAEEEFERASLTTLLEQRKDMVDFLSGKRLLSSTLSIFDENKEEIQKFMDEK